MFGIVITWLWVVFLCAIVWCVVWIVQTINDRRPPKKLKIPAHKIVTYPGSQPTPIRKAQIPQADPHQITCRLLRDRILGMVYHVNGNAKQNPPKSKNWWWLYGDTFGDAYPQ
jgi:hypothetical protein